MILFNSKHSLIGAVFAMILLTISVANAGYEIDIESGQASMGYNDVQIPGDTGTRFSLTKDLSSSSEAFVRGRLTLSFSERHQLSVLIAPLRIKSSGVISKDISFENTLFNSGSDIRARYRFDSYRLTYRYLLIENPSLDFRFGLTGKIRDASISLSDSANKQEKSNIGFVPLINFYLRWYLNERYSVLFEGDALAASQGRAEDVFIGLRGNLGERIALKAGYRMLEGGADVESVYNFALVNYFSAGAIILF
jgi:hypothetical protein